MDAPNQFKAPLTEHEEAGLAPTRPAGLPGRPEPQKLLNAK